MSGGAVALFLTGALGGFIFGAAFASLTMLRLYTNAAAEAAKSRTALEDVRYAAETKIIELEAKLAAHEDGQRRKTRTMHGD